MTTFIGRKKNFAVQIGKNSVDSDGCKKRTKKIVNKNEIKKYDGETSLWFNECIK